MPQFHANPTQRGTRWTVTAFYLLIALEFFYMASPFAAYLYSVYRPGLAALEGGPATAWLVAFFLPHYAQTRSVLINSAVYVGLGLLVAGLALFLVGAVQIYHAKLRRQGAVTGGVYRVLRHPQYTGLIVSGFGMLLVWPRYLVVLLYVTMLFVYTWLARIEEQECERRFGDAYRQFLARTRRFLPFDLPFRLPWFAGRWVRWPAAVRIPLAYVLILAAAMGIAHGAHALTVRSLYAHYATDAAWVSLSPLDEDRIRRLADIALTDEAVQTRLQLPAGARQLNYVLREGAYVSEVPMHRPAGARSHRGPAAHDSRSYRIVFTRAILRTDRQVQGPDIVRNTVARVPLVEAHVDLVAERITGVLDPPAEESYAGVPVPIY